MILLRRLGLAISLLCGLLAAQLPEFAQQYRQRLGGAIDELTAIIAQFDTEATANGLTRLEGIARLQNNTDPLVNGRGTAMRETIARAARLAEQRDEFARLGNFGRVAALFSSFDSGIAKNAYASFEPAMPATSEGVVAGLIGFFGAGLSYHLLSWPLRRRLRRPLAPQAGRGPG